MLFRYRTAFPGFPELIVESGTLPPLYTQAGTESDHLAVHLLARMPRVAPYKIQQYSYLKQTAEGDETFAKELRSACLDSINDEQCPTKMVDKLHELFEHISGKAYVTKTTKKKSNQPPWINDHVLGLIANRRTVYRREKRSTEWKKLKRKTASIIKKRKAYFNKLKRDKMLGCNSRSFHRCVKSFVSDEKANQWSPRHMFPDLSAKQVAERCADFFNGISNEYRPLQPEDIPNTYDAPPLKVTAKMVENEILKGKKPKSRVEGDIFVNVLVSNIKLLSPTIAKIYNRIVVTGTWPRAWKIEHVTVIPKGNVPEDPSKCRNISCTNFLSKVFERIVFKYAKQQVTPKTNQFGGEKGCSTNHFLAELWDQITEHLEDSRAASILTSIDYSKAFNRLEHSACLKAFANKGASNQLLRLLASFLTNRQMTVKVEGSRSLLRPVNAGAPQGSVLGTYIFNIGTDNLEEDFDFNNQDQAYEIDEGDLGFLDTETDLTRAQSTPQRHDTPPNFDLSPVSSQPHDFTISPLARNVPPRLVSRIEPTWRAKPITVKKFIDDNIQNEKLHIKKTQTYFEHGKMFKNARAGESEQLFKHISARANEQGLLVNSEKTTLLAISDAKSYEARAHIYDQTGSRIDSTSTLKALGFVFNSSADVSNQVDALCKRFRSRTWALRDLRKAGLSTDDLIRVYKSTIRPIIEYSSVIYHPMLTEEQTEYIEKQQTRALKNIFGNQYSRRRLYELSGIPPLGERREQACLRFATKMANTQRFSRHFIKKKSRARAKTQTEYVEQKARTNRRKNSPLFYYRKLLNGNFTYS